MDYFVISLPGVLLLLFFLYLLLTIKKKDKLFVACVIFLAINIGYSVVSLIFTESIDFLNLIGSITIIISYLFLLYIFTFVLKNKREFQKNCSEMEKTDSQDHSM